MRPKPRASERAAIATTFAFCAFVLAGSAAAQERAPKKDMLLARRQAQCDRYGPGFMALKDSDACIRISGYVTAGAGFATGGLIGGRPPPFRPLPATGVMSAVGVSAQAAFDTPLGPARVVIEGNSASFGR